MKRILLASAMLALAACASNPGYSRASSPAAAGYSEQIIEKDRWRVRYTGTSRMTSAQVQDYALMRAAQLTLERGADWFEVVNSDTDANSKRRYSIETDFGPDYAVYRSCGLVGCTTRAAPVIARMERETVEQRTVFEHSMEIVMGSGAKRANGSARSYDARETYGSLNAQIG
jgi:flavin-binding protein dodecin